MKKLSRLLTIAPLVLLLVLPGCAKKHLAGEVPMVPSPDVVARSEVGMQAPAQSRPPEMEAPQVDPARSGRLMIYNGLISLVVDDIYSVMGQIRRLAEASGGYMQSMDGHTIMVRVPADQLDGIIAAVENLGELAHKEIRGNDVTEEMRDLIIRLDNADALRKRLIKLLKRADLVEDAIKIENELARVTETIELLQGKIRYLNNQVALSTLTVQLNSPLPQQALKKIIPFAWVRQLGRELTEDMQFDYVGRIDGYGVRFDLSPSFAKYHQDRYLTRATSADGVLLKVQRHANINGTPMEFWLALIKRALLEGQNILIGETGQLKAKRAKSVLFLDGTKTIANQKQAYLIAIAVSKRYVTTFEAWGELANFEKERAAILDAVRSMRVP
jgi:hypothetical protein